MKTFGLRMAGLEATRRRLVLGAGALASAAVLLGGMRDARAQDYPSQDIRLICAFPAGSGADVLVRYFAEKLRPIASRTVIVENKVGASGNIAAEYLAKSKPDGHTIFVHAATAVAANQSLFRKAPFDAAKDIRIAATINQQPWMLAVRSDSPYKTVAELTAAMKEKGDKASFSTNAPTGRIMAALYKQAAGLTAVEVIYRTAPDTLNELTSGKLDYALYDPVFALAQQRAGRVRLLASGSSKRFDAIADLPTMTELGMPMDVTNWWAAMVPTGTPKPTIDKIHRWFVQMVSSDETKEYLNKFGGEAYITTPEKAQELFEAAIKEWGDYVRIAKIEPLG
ncbi:MAG TPA: tripartite tricarboxylate transporter substrate binding protein [Hyphomicrobiaceae bacterium]|jgi:tripartite-type tricarboxylate transporter receptor subunit TctC|nr:tripartite tricarboxylate transporter substrate binding protein [Hyphomicrobiaceae bacterium]